MVTFLQPWGKWVGNDAETSWNFCLIVPVHVRMCPYIIKVIGLGLGLTIWDLSYMLMGWFTGYFGLFGIPKEDNVKTPSINYVGLVMVSLSLIFFSLASAYDTSDMRDVMNKSDAEPASKEGRHSHFELIQRWVWDPSLGFIGKKTNNVWEMRNCM